MQVKTEKKEMRAKLAISAERVAQGEVRGSQRGGDKRRRRHRRAKEIMQRRKTAKPKGKKYFAQNKQGLCIITMKNTNCGI